MSRRGLMLRWIDLIGFAGFALVVLGTLFLFPSSAEGMNWHYMLGGFASWAVGFASVVGWIFLRFWQVGKPHPK